jgi:hypothetical protein
VAGSRAQTKVMNAPPGDIQTIPSMNYSDMNFDSSDMYANTEAGIVNRKVADERNR